MHMIHTKIPTKIHAETHIKLQIHAEVQELAL